MVKERSGQKNLQLIIITHDEEFVKLLLQEGLIDRFVKVSKNLQGQSELEEETNIGELRE